MPPTPAEVLKHLNNLLAAGIKDGPEWYNTWADYWRYVIGANVIPAIGRIKNFHKDLTYTKWQNAPISDEQHEQWKAEKKFDGGMAVLAGRIWHRQDRKHLYLNLIDCDNQKAIDEVICTSVDGSYMTLQQAAQYTVIEQHAGAPNKAHVYVYSTRPFPKKSSDNIGPLADKLDANEIPAMEVKGEGGHGVHFVCPSPHPDGTSYQIIGIREPAIVDGFDKHIDNVLAKYGIPYLSAVSDDGSNRSQIPIEELFKEDFRIFKDHNRHGAILRIMDSLLSRNKAILSLEKIKQLSREWNQEHCMPPLNSREFEGQWKDATEYIAREEKKKENQHQQNSQNQNDVPAESSPEFKELEGRLQNLLNLYHGLDDIVCTPEFIKQKYSIKTTRPDKEIFYFDKEKGIFLPDGQIVIEEELEGTNEKLNTVYAEICIVLNEFYKNIEDDEKRNQQIRLRLQEEHISNPQPWTKHHIDEFKGHIERQTYFYRYNFNPNKEWLACLDCMVNLMTGETTAFDPKYLNTTFIPVNYHVYKPYALGSALKEYSSCPRIMKFLHEVMEPDDVETVLDFIAYCLWREYKFHNWILLNGEGQNGKSTLLRVIERFLGRHNVSGESLQRILERNFSSAQLYGKLANIDADLSSDGLKNTGLLKKLTGGDKITGEYKHKSLFEFTNHAKLLFSANQMPGNVDMTNAFFRRLIIINFTRQFFGDKDNPNLYYELTTEEELSGLLHVCIQRLPRVLKEGIRKTTDESMQKTQDQYIMSMDPVRYFVDKALNKNTPDNTRKKTVFESYIKFCCHFKLPVESEQSFSRKLTDIYGLSYKQFRDNGEKVNCWVGVKVSDWLALEDKDQTTFEDIG